ncbi:type I-B CRISPR-associated protein Cas7/Csh2 [Methanosarcina mazei]|nr:type I-B CRISPR-associated protein Cas7/Csh2 [Methanosarcina mazei]
MFLLGRLYGKMIQESKSYKGGEDKQSNESHLEKNFFGAVITKPKYDITGPLQVMWSKSVNPAEIKFMQGNSAYAGGEGKSQSTIWSKYISPYAIFKTYAVYNDNAAKRQGIETSEKDLNEFTAALINGLINYRSTSKNQMPRLLVEVIYKEHRIDGELNYVDVNFDTEAEEVRVYLRLLLTLKNFANIMIYASSKVSEHES